MPLLEGRDPGVDVITFVLAHVSSSSLLLISDGEYNVSGLIRLDVFIEDEPDADGGCG